MIFLIDMSSKNLINVKIISNLLKDSEVFFIINYDNIPVKEMYNLRLGLKKNGFFFCK